MTEADRRLTNDVLPTVLLLCGVVLIALSFMPLSGLAKREWTIKDSQALSRVTRELHDSTLESPTHSGRTPEEFGRYQENLERQFKKLNSKLEHARQEPHRWSRILLWTGAGLTAAGAIIHLSKQKA